MEPSERQARLARFWKKYLRLTRAGVPVLQTLVVMGEEERDPDFAQVLKTLHKELQEGHRLSEALGRFPDRFSLSTIELVRTAERRGAWDEILTELSDGLLEGTFE
ncbi:MAG: type II secretion system F family protein [Kiritimatiellae bacterium]|nr:type II secretion system F family protein [Kiritimatiellia bacterium]